MSINLNTIIFIVNFSILFLVLLFYSFYSFLLNYDLIEYVLLLVILLNLLFIFRSEKNLFLRKNLFKHSTFVLMGLLVVNFQYYLDYYLGYIDKSDLLINVGDQAGAKSLMIGLIGLISFFIGFLIKKNTVVKENFSHTIVNSIFLNILSILFLAGFLLNVNPLYVFGGYGIYEMGSNAIYFMVLFKASFFALIIQKTLNVSQQDKKLKNIWLYIKNIGYTNILVLFIYVATVILSGDRGDIMTFSLLMLVGYINFTAVKINRIKSILMIFLAAFVITLLGVARSFNTLENSTFVEKISKAINGDSNKRELDSILPVTSELAGSVKALNYSVQYVPSEYDYLYSRFQIQAILGVIPFSASINNYIFEDNSSKYSSSDSYVTWLIEGDNATTGHGTSIAADFYLSYGVIGVILGMGFFGWLVRFCELNIEFKKSKYIIFIIISVVIFTSSLYLSRSSLLPSLRLIVWIWVLMSLNSWLSQKIKKVA